MRIQTFQQNQSIYGFHKMVQSRKQADIYTEKAKERRTECTSLEENFMVFQHQQAVLISECLETMLAYLYSDNLKHFRFRRHALSHAFQDRYQDSWDANTIGLVGRVSTPFLCQHLHIVALIMFIFVSRTKDRDWSSVLTRIFSGSTSDETVVSNFVDSISYASEWTFCN